MFRKNGNKDEHKDKFDENSKECMDIIDNENSSEEKELNREKKNDDSKPGDGIEEFI